MIHHAARENTIMPTWELNPLGSPQGGIKTRLLRILMIMGYYGNRELVYKARSLRKNMTKAEIILWSRLRSKKVNGFKFRRQQPIFDYIVDFYCDSLKLIIEVDGEIHDQPELTKSDSKRDNTLKINGYKIIRLSNKEVETEIDLSINKITTFITSILPHNQGTTRGRTNEKYS